MPLFSLDYLNFENSKVLSVGPEMKVDFICSKPSLDGKYILNKVIILYLQK